MNAFDPITDQRAFRTALGAYATGITVITAPSQDGPVGITANSFASVSLDPPLVLWSPAKSSKRFKYFTDAAHFAIHVLDTQQKHLCDAFSKNMFATEYEDWATNAHGVPLIENCLARFECDTHAQHDAGDHVIIIGRVTGASARNGQPLLFQGGRFVSLKDEL